MFSIVNATPKEIIITYIVFMGACMVTYPIIRLLITSIEKGVSKWK